MERTVCPGDLYRHRRCDPLRPVWYLFDKLGDGRIAAVVFLGNPLVLWPALPALGICLRDWIVARRADAFLIRSFYFGPYLAWAMLPRTLGFIYYYLPSATTASLALYAEARQQPALAVMGLSQPPSQVLRRCCRSRPRSWERRWRPSTG